MRVLVDGARVVGLLANPLPPAFLLDAERMGRARSPPPGAFDNRSICRASDFPSADTLLRAGVRRVVLVRGHRAIDLEAVLFAWQSRGIAVWEMDADGEADAKPIVLQERPWLLRVGDWLRGGFLSRRSDGSYGLMVPHGG
jgi:hypothetical protein